MSRFTTLFLISTCLLLSVLAHQKIVAGDNIYLIPDEAEHTETLIYIHGLGQNAQIMYDQLFADPATMIARKSTKVVLLTAHQVPVTILKGKVKNSWFDISTFNVSSESQLGGAFNFDEIIASSLIIKKQISDEIELLHGESTKVFIGGFSQGCFMSLYCALTFDKPLGGIVGSGGYLVPIAKINSANARLPMILTHGTADTIIYFDLAEQLYKQRLSGSRPEITKVYEEGIGHIITPTMQARARQWFLAQTESKNHGGFLPIFA
jgi:phospholipase/carboxylesterase